MLGACHGIWGSLELLFHSGCVADLGYPSLACQEGDAAVVCHRPPPQSVYVEQSDCELILDHAADNTRSSRSRVTQTGSHRLDHVGRANRIDGDEQGRPRQLAWSVVSLWCDANLNGRVSRHILLWSFDWGTYPTSDCASQSGGTCDGDIRGTYAVPLRQKTDRARTGAIQLFVWLVDGDHGRAPDRI